MRRDKTRERRDFQTNWSFLDEAQTRAEGANTIKGGLQKPLIQTRRQFLAGISLAGTAGLLGARPTPAAQPSLETTTVRIAGVPGICSAPQYVAEELLRADGFTDVRYVHLAPGHNTPEGIASGEVDFGLNFASVLVAGLDRGIDLTVLGACMSAASNCL